MVFVDGYFVSMGSAAKVGMPAVLPPPNSTGVTKSSSAFSSSFTIVKVPVLAISNLARYAVNFKSSYCDADHVVAFCDLNNEPSVGCVEMALVPPISISPKRDIHTL